MMSEHYDDWQIGEHQVFLDSPMAIEATETYAQFRDQLGTELFRPGTSKPTLKNLAFSRTPEDSMAINAIESGAIIIAASGRRLVDGADQVRIFGEEIRVNASIHTVGGLSALASYLTTETGQQPKIPSLGERIDVSGLARPRRKAMS
jgi:metallo-beta-lactamase family protein